MIKDFHILVDYSQHSSLSITHEDATSTTRLESTSHYWGALLAPAQTTSWKTTHCWLSATGYSIYSQLPSISGGRLLYPQPEDAPCRGDSGPT
jgi:hypothetical protein